MGVFNGVFPIEAGKEHVARVFAAEAAGARASDLAAHLVWCGDVTRVMRAVQETPMGSLLVVRFEGDVRRPSPTSP